MRIEMSLLASIQMQNISGELKQWVTDCIATLEAGKELSAEPTKTSANAFVAKFKDYRLVFKRLEDAIELQGVVVLDPELRQQLQEMAR